MKCYVSLVLLGLEGEGDQDKGMSFCLTSPSTCVTEDGTDVTIPQLTIIASASASRPLIVRVAMFPELEPENQSGIPKGWLLSLYKTSSGAWPGCFWYQKKHLPPMPSPEQVNLAIFPMATNTEHGWVSV